MKRTKKKSRAEDQHESEEEDFVALKFVPPEGEREGFRIAWNKDCLKARDSQGIGLVNS